MKKLLLFAFLGMSILAFITGCKKDQVKVNENAINKFLKGQWFLRSINSGSITDGKTYESQVIDYTNSGQYISFNENGKGINNENAAQTFITNINYTLKDTVLTINYDKVTSPEGVNFEAFTRVCFVHTIGEFSMTLNTRLETTNANGKKYTLYEVLKYEK